MKRMATLSIIFVLLLSNIIAFYPGINLGYGEGSDIQPITESSPTGSRAIHPIISINSTTEFNTKASIEGWSGNGFPNNPYIIEGYTIDAKGYGNCIYIANTTLNFIIRNCLLTNASGMVSPIGYGAGITLNNIQNGRVEENNISNNKIGVFLYTSNLNTIINNTCSFNNQSGIMLDSTSDYNTVSNNTCESNNNYGIFITMSFYNKVENNTCNSNGDNGVYLYLSAKNNVINNNTCDQNDLNGIVLDSTCSDNTISNNTCINNNRFGIEILNQSNDIIVKNNICTNNIYFGITVYLSLRAIIINNSCSYNNIGITILFVDSSKISDNVCKYNNRSGITLGESDQNTIINNTLNLNYEDGLGLIDSDYNIVTNNFCNQNYDNGLLIKSSQYNTINSNNFSFNKNGTGLNGLSSSALNNELYNNNISYNTQYGMSFIGSCDDNRFYHNKIISNSNQVGGTTTGTIYWDDASNEGNYWSDYSGLDNGANGRSAGDGIGDTNIPHPNSAYDNYPFIDANGWEILPIPELFDPGYLNSTGSYNITWNFSSRAVGYVLEEDINNTFSSSSVIYDGSELTHEITNKIDGTYFYRLKVYNNYTESEWSLTADIDVDWSPVAPSGLVASEVTGHNVTLDWNANPESDIDGYNIYINDTGADSSGPFKLFNYSIGTQNQFSTTSLVNETTYHFAIKARDKSKTLSDYSNVVSFTTKDITAPSAPLGLSANAISDTEIELKWTLGPETDIAGYQIFQNKSNEGVGGFYNLSHTIIGQYDSYIVTGLFEQVTYHFKIRAFDEVPNNSSFSVVVSETTPDIIPPAAPTGLRATYIGITNVTLAWDANSEDDVVSYNIFRLAGTNLSFELVGSTNETTFDDVGLLPQVSYYYKIMAIDDWGWNSSFSDNLMVITNPISKQPIINNSIEDFSMPEESYDDSSIDLLFWFKSPDNSPMTFSVDNDVNINVTIFNENGTVILVPKENWNGEETLTFRARVEDEYIFDSITIEVTSINDPPEQVKITTPVNGYSMEYGYLVSFRGDCVDHDLIYGDVLNYSWSSDKDGFLGGGKILDDRLLSTGSHVITLTVTDKANTSSSNTITITVNKKTSSEDDDPKTISNAILIASILIIIIVVLIVVSLVILKKKKSTKEDDQPPEPMSQAEPEITEPDQPALPAEPSMPPDQPQELQEFVPVPEPIPEPEPTPTPAQPIEPSAIPTQTPSDMTYIQEPQQEITSTESIEIDSEPLLDQYQMAPEFAETETALQTSEPVLETSDDGHIIQTTPPENSVPIESPQEPVSEGTVPLEQPELNPDPKKKAQDTDLEGSEE